MFKAKDIMNSDIVTITPYDTVDRALSLMLQYRITGLIVIGSDNRPLGVVSDFDLLDMVYDCHAKENPVSRYMSGEVYQVAEDAGWTDVADIFREKRIRRLPVTRNGKLVGIVTRHDLMRTIQGLRRRTRELLSKAQPHEHATGTAVAAEDSPQAAETP